MKRIATVAEMRELVDAWHEAGDTVALVPTMGNLHAGHMSLVDLAAQHAEHVVVSIFVNPTQFGPSEDFADYPRTPDMDLRRLQRAGVDVVFEPSVEEIYPRGTDGVTEVVVPDLSELLDGAARPGHFTGVTSVVTRLFNICEPDTAVFGQKDYQQLVILRRMVADLHMPVSIVAAPTARADSGLALSSRNGYLNADQLEQATAISAALTVACEALQSGAEDYAQLEHTARAAIDAAGLSCDYVQIRAAVDLSEPGADTLNLVVLAAARLGDVRLIDNMLVTRAV
ncbi:MAG: pantoate--beta-alanine ligase [Gammaproteobacteria bacterium]|nr:pantoate--beta-alanine ligase [Gammaproteobacteria bacterium]